MYNFPFHTPCKQRLFLVHKTNTNFSKHMLCVKIFTPAFSLHPLFPSAVFNKYLRDIIFMQIYSLFMQSAFFMCHPSRAITADGANGYLHLLLNVVY